MLSTAFIDLYHEVRSAANLVTLLVTASLFFGSLMLLVRIAFTRRRRLSQRAALIVSSSFIVLGFVLLAAAVTVELDGRAMYTAACGLIGIAAGMVNIMRLRTGRGGGVGA